MEEVWGDRKMTLGRELTKLHEEFFRGTISTCRQHLQEGPIRGEFVLVVEQGKVGKRRAPGRSPDAVKILLAQGTDKKEALAQVAKAYKVPKRELYNRLVRE